MTVLQSLHFTAHDVAVNDGPCHVLPEVSEDGGTAAGREGISQITEADAVIRHPGSMKAKK